MVMGKNREGDMEEDLKWKVARVNGRKRRTKTKMVLLLWSHGMVRVRLNLAPDILGILDNRAKGGSKELILDSGTLGVYLKSLFWEFILGVYSTSLFWEYSGIGRLAAMQRTCAILASRGLVFAAESA